MSRWLHDRRLDRPKAYLFLAAIWLPTAAYLIWGR